MVAMDQKMVYLKEYFYKIGVFSYNHIIFTKKLYEKITKLYLYDFFLHYLWKL